MMDVPEMAAAQSAASSPRASSPSSSVTRSTETTFSSSAVSKTMTPWLPRPTMRMPLTGQRISCPPSVTSMIWSASSTGKEAISGPLRPFTAMATMPLPPRRVVRYSKDEVRLP